MNPQMNMNNDRQHLKLLSIFHYIVGGILAFFFLFPLIHFTIGLLIITESISVTPPEILVFLRYGLHPLLIHSLGDNPRSLHDYCSLPPVR